MFARAMITGALAASGGGGGVIINEPDRANAILLASLADVGDGLDLTDYSPLRLDLSNSGAVWQTSVQKNYGGAAYFNGTNIFSATNASFALGSGDFAIGFWARFHSGATNYKAPLRIGGLTTFDGYIAYKDTNNLDLYLSNSGGGWAKNGTYYGTFDSTAWHYYTLSRSSGTLYTSKDGAVTNIGAMSGSVYQSANKFVIGGNQAVYIQDVRIFNIAKWTANFTPPGALVTYAEPSYPPPLWKSTGLASGMAVSGGGSILTITAPGSGNIRHSVVDNVIPSGQKVYIEIHVGGSLTSSVGVGCGSASLHGTTTGDWGGDGAAWEWRNDGNTRGGSGGERGTQSWSTNDILKLAFDPTTGGIWFGTNSGWYSNLVPGVDSPVETSSKVAAGKAIEIAANFGGSGVFTIPATPTYSVPSGFTYLPGP